ncbi:MFS general substrate transporter-like protein [Pochonia chlamydosporia 170]|uniref:MFS general substrate transporter-like protein n=1 Tax=Pochonia chlamydosporia 170 TaxID=1380566 RepID=A0A179F432_METCM|nr:MFS general substrate transporter-like protein [Pochonia chlamydosporia 170]OAQ59869.1 MFS general substrate transporter-like protein [Pochonia chlamydosporia 170]
MAKDSNRPQLVIQPKPGVANRTASANSFHAGAPIPTLGSFRRQSSTHKYQTFPVQPPKTPLEPTIPSEDASSASSEQSSASGEDAETTPLPVRQLLLLAFLSLSEQTALNSIGPYLPEMVATMPGIPDGQGGLYVGMLASAFALAQLSTNFLWGYASDIVGRKPVLIAGTFSLMGCFCVFGFCKAYWQMVVIHALMGLLNGNAACVPTVLGEVTDRSNQSKAFTYLPVIYSLGSITGPALGGILVNKMGSEYPYLGPNVLGAAMLAASVVVVGIWFEETLDESGDSPWRPAWINRLSAWIDGSDKPEHRRGSWSSRLARASASQQPLLSSASSTSSSVDEDEENQDGDDAKNNDGIHGRPVWKDLLNHTTIILLSTYLVFQLSNISFNSLYPIFASAPAPAGRELSPSKIGFSLSLAGLATIIFQAFLFQPIKSRIGNLGSYRYALFGLGVSMMLMPWVGYLDDKPPLEIGTGRLWLYAELAVVLVLKNICAVGGLSSVMLLITNSAPSHASLGTLNGVAQTLSALGRSIGPFVSGGLFTLSVNIRPKGEALAWSLFGGLALLGWCVSMFIRGDGLESEDWSDGESSETA